VQCSAVQCRAVQCRAVPCSAVQCRPAKGRTRGCAALRCTSEASRCLPTCNRATSGALTGRARPAEPHLPPYAANMTDRDRGFAFGYRMRYRRSCAAAAVGLSRCRRHFKHFARAFAVTRRDDRSVHLRRLRYLSATPDRCTAIYLSSRQGWPPMPQPRKSTSRSSGVRKAKRTAIMRWNNVALRFPLALRQNECSSQSSGSSAYASESGSNKL
jgi:hypothetical protein